MEILSVGNKIEINSGEYEGERGTITDIRDSEQTADTAKDGAAMIMEVTREYEVELEGSKDRQWMPESMLDKLD